MKLVFVAFPLRTQEKEQKLVRSEKGYSGRVGRHVVSVS
jgi:hypothetical protein